MIKSISKILSVVLFLASSAGTISSAMAAPALSPEQMKTEIVNRPFLYQGVEGGQRKAGRIFYRSDARVLILARRGVLDGGNWLIKQGKFCTRIELDRRNNLRCFSIFEESRKRYPTDHGYFLYPVDDKPFAGN